MANEGSILNKVPDEIWLNIISNLHDELDQIMLSRACRRTRGLFPSIHFFVATKYWKEEELETFALRRWVDLVKLDGTRQLVGKAGCGTCKRVHDISAFETAMLAKPANDRACKGVQGRFRVCEHMVVHFEDIQVALKNQDLRLLCDEHPYKAETYDERIFWDMGLMKDPKKKEIRVVSDEYNVIGIWTGFPCMATGYERAVEREALEDILARDEKPICRHLRRCDLMATYLQDENHRAKDLDHPKFCSHPSCLTTFAFTDSGSGTVLLEVVRYLGMARSPSDPYWLTAINEMKEIKEVAATEQMQIDEKKEVDATEQMQVDEKKEVDTQQDGEAELEEKTEHPLFGTSHENTRAQGDVVSAVSRHPPEDDYL